MSSDVRRVGEKPAAPAISSHPAVEIPETTLKAAAKGPEVFSQPVQVPTNPVGERAKALGSEKTLKAASVILPLEAEKLKNELEKLFDDMEKVTTPLCHFFAPGNPPLPPAIAEAQAKLPELVKKIEKYNPDELKPFFGWMSGIFIFASVLSEVSDRESDYQDWCQWIQKQIIPKIEFALSDQEAIKKEHAKKIRAYFFPLDMTDFKDDDKKHVMGMLDGQLQTLDARKGNLIDICKDQRQLWHQVKELEKKNPEDFDPAFKNSVGCLLIFSYILSFVGDEKNHYNPKWKEWIANQLAQNSFHGTGNFQVDYAVCVKSRLLPAT